MELDNDKISEVEGQESFIVRSSGTFNPKLYWEKNYRDQTPSEEMNKELFDNFLSSSLDLIFRELIEVTKSKYPVEYVGVWVKGDDGTEMDNSMELKTFDEITEYSQDDNIVPIYEFYKMTLAKNSPEPETL